MQENKMNCPVCKSDTIHLVGVEIRHLKNGEVMKIFTEKRTEVDIKDPEGVKIVQMMRCENAHSFELGAECRAGRTYLTTKPVEI